MVEGYDSYEAMPKDERDKAEALLAEIDTIGAKRSAYDPAVIERGGVFVSLGSNGEVKVERGFVRAEDEPQPEPEPQDETGEGIEQEEDEATEDDEDTEEEDADPGKPISDSLVRDLTAHRTLGLRLALGEQPDMAMVALTHALVTHLFYHGFSKSCLAISAKSEELGSHADAIANTVAGEALAARHDQWGVQLPSEAADLWPCIAAMDSGSRTELLAHCVSLTVNAVKLPWERSANRIEAAEGLAQAVDLDMTATWEPTARSYFGRVTKARIAQAVSEAVSPEAAERILPMKKEAMAEAAEQLVAGTGWLPVLLRTAKPEPEPEADEAEQPEPETGDEDAYSIAAE